MLTGQVRLLNFSRLYSVASFVRMLDPENKGVAVGIAANVDFSLTVASGSSTNHFIGMADLENGFVAVEISLLSYLEVEICLGVFLPPVE